MIVDKGTYYLYRHIRKDTNEPFYIGIGKKHPEGVSEDVVYGRAYSTKYRNRFWKFIANKSQYEIEILLESDDRNFIQQKEIEFIKLYGRRDTKTGPLCNLTDGGDNGLNRSKLAVKKQLDTAKKNGTYEDMVARIKKYATKRGQIGSSVQKRTFLYKTDGTFIKEFKSREECSKYTKISEPKICSYIKDTSSSRGFIFSNNQIKDFNDLIKFRIKKNRTRMVVQINPVNNSNIKIHESLTVAAASVGSRKESLFTAIKKGYKHRGFIWNYLDK